MYIYKKDIVWCSKRITKRICPVDAKTYIIKDIWDILVIYVESNAEDN